MSEKNDKILDRLISKNIVYITIITLLCISLSVYNLRFQVKKE